MKKSKILKLLVSALSLCLIIGAMVGITAMADGSGDANKPEIISYNISYSDELYLYYAVDADLVDGQSIELWVCDSEGNVLEDKATETPSLRDDFNGKITEYEVMNVWGEDCYVFITNGVAAKDINAAEYVKAVIVDSEGEKVSESDLVEYSVMQYLYQRLYMDEMIAATEEMNLIRRELYLDLLSYGAAAQELLLNDKLTSGAIVPIRGAKMFSAIDGNGTKFYVSDEVQLNHDGSKVPEGKIFYGWSVYTYSQEGVKNTEYPVFANRAKVDTTGIAALIATPIYEDEGFEGDIPTLDAVVGMIDFTDAPTAEQMDCASAGGTIIENGNGDYYLGITQNNNWTQMKTTPIYAEEGANTVEISADLYMPQGNTYEFGVNVGDTRVYYFGIGVQSGKLALRSYYDNNTQNLIWTPLADNGDYIDYNEWFNLKFVIEEGPYNYGNYGLHVDVYLNGELLTSIGHVFNTVSSISAIDRFYFYGNSSNVGTYKIDNFVFKKTVEEVDTGKSDYVVDFTTEGHFNPKPDPKNGVRYNTASDYNTINVLDSYTDKNGVTYNNVGHINKVANSASIAGIIVDREFRANVAVFEFDYCATDGAIELWVINNSGSTFFIGLNSGGDNASIGGATANLNEWTHAKVVYYVNESGSSVATITVNGVTKTATKAGAYLVSNVAGLNFNVASQGVGDYYIDNFKSYAYYDSAYDFVELPEKQGITFDDGEIPAIVTGANGSAVTHTVVDFGEGNKALRIEKPATGWKDAGLKVKVTETEENADTLVFECDMFVTKYNAMAVYIGGVYTKVCSNSKNEVQFEGAKGELGKWVHFKLEYTKIEVEGVVKGQTIVTIDGTSHTYVNEESVDLASANEIVFAVQTATIHDTVYDNIVCKKICSSAE